MGSLFEINDTLQITSDQGFPEELDFEVHKNKELKSSDFEDKIFEFNNKEKIRIYQAPPVRNFLVHNINGKWLYWGMIHVLEVTHDNINKTTSGKYKIIYINTVDEMKTAHDIMDRTDETNFFN